MADALVELLRSEECAPLLKRLVKRLEHGKMLSRRCGLGVLTEQECNAIGKLCRLRGPRESSYVDLGELEQIVTSTKRFDSLETLVRQCSDGRIVNRRAEEEASRHRWDLVLEEATTLAGNDLDIAAFVSQPSFMKSLRNLSDQEPARAEMLLEQAFDLLNLLPVDPIQLPVFAARELGDAHALDSSSPLLQLLIRLLTGRFGMEVPKSARDRREILELAGIYVDELSSTVLSLNLPAGGVGVADRTLQCHADAGMPCRLTFRHLRHDPPVLDDADQVLLRSGPRRLFVCENPSVLAAAADALGPRCPPLLCLEGNPSVACMRLLDLLCSAGFKIWYHGDFDWGGIRIANRIYERFGFRPWRFQAGDYEPHRSQGRALKGSPVDAGWDSGLRAVVEQGGQAVDEETDIESLLKDLREASAGKRQ